MNTHFDPVEVRDAAGRAWYETLVAKHIENPEMWEDLPLESRNDYSDKGMAVVDAVLPLIHGGEQPSDGADQGGSMLTVGGKPFRCECGANVFTKISQNRYVCNGCTATYQGES